MSSNPVSNPTTSVETVLNTTELLEHILNFLPMPKILGKSRVSRTWKAVIDNSPVLQKKLFFRHNGNQAGVISIGHLFPQPQGLPQNLSIEQSDLLMSLVNKPVYTTPIELNPLADRSIQVDLHVSHQMLVHHPEQLHPSLAGVEVMLGNYNRAYVRHHFSDSPQTSQAISSWRNMYLTSPPITEVVFTIPSIVGNRPSVLKTVPVNLYASHGVTLGLMYDRLEEQLKQVHIRDVRHRTIKSRDGPLTGNHYVEGWGMQPQDEVMFLVQHTQNPTDVGSQ